jgi:zinc transport system ATP-binding protein
VNSRVVSLLQVNFSYQQEPVLAGVSLEVNRGDFLGLIGPNGAGKTTLLQIMVGLLAPKSGQVELFGQPLAEFKDWVKLGYVSQRAAQLESGFPATVAEVVAAGRFARVGLGRKFSPADRDAVNWALEMVGLQDYRQRAVSHLSGGQKQRVAIGRALAGQPELMILDEPAVGVDPAARERFYHLLADLNKELGLTLILVSHDIGAVVAHAINIAWLNRRIMFHGSAKDMLQQNMLELYGYYELPCTFPRQVNLLR